MYTSVVIPSFDSASGNLPPGVHETRWDEVVERFGYTAHRRDLLQGLLDALQILRAAGCRRAYLDGSFVTTKQDPGDFDACWDVDGVDLVRLAQDAPAFFDLRFPRAAQKERFRGELLPVQLTGDPSGRAVFEEFQRDIHTGAAKGIIAIDLDTLP
jgi:hypothetical protein